MSFVRRGLMAVAAASALWLSLGVLAVVGAHAGDGVPLDSGFSSNSFVVATRIALWAPAWAWVLLVAICLSVGVGPGVRARDRASAAFWLPAILLILPWLPFPVPAAFLLWTGPLVVLLWITLAAGVWQRLRMAGGAARAAALLRVLRHPVRAPLIAGVLAAALYLFAGWQLSGLLPAGDEPHYLIIADSLRRDGDLRIENNHRAHQYLDYIDGALKPDFLRRGVDGQIYSIHAPGLPVLLLPVHALFGYAGSVTFLALLSAAGSVLAWRLAWTLAGGAGGAGAAWLAWAAVALPVPVLFHACSIYPDGVGAVLVLTGAAALIHASSLTVPRALLHGAALAYLPWLHTRFVLLAAALATCIIARIAFPPAAPPMPGTAPSPLTSSSAMPARSSRRTHTRTRLIAAFLAVPVLSAIVWFAFFYAIYGTPNPLAPYGTYTQSALAHVPAGLTGLLFDQQFGAIANAPIYLVGFCAIAWMLAARTRPDLRRLGAELIIVIVPYVIAAAMYRMWWGGRSAPARFLVPVLPLIALAAAAGWSAARTLTSRASTIVALAVSVWMSAVMLIAEHGRLVHNDRDGFALWTEWVNPAVDLAAGLPSLFQTPWPVALGRAAIWLAAILLTWLVLRAIERRWRQAGSAPPAFDSAFVTAIVPVGYAVAAMIALGAIWTIARVSGVLPDLSQVALLRQAQSGWRPIGVVYDGPRAWPRIGRASAVPERMRIHSATRRIPRERPLFFMPSLPAGRYRAIVSPPFDGRLDVYVGRSSAPLRSIDARTPDLTLPVGVTSLSIRGDERARGKVGPIALVPIGQLSSSELDADLLARQTIRYGNTSVYATSDAVYLEPGGFWVQPEPRPGAAVDVVIEPDQPATTVTLLLRNGPAANQVRVDVESWHRTVTVAPGGEMTIDLPASRHGATPLRVRPAAGFRPSALDPGNGDHRRLGVWVELR